METIACILYTTEKIILIKNSKVVFLSLYFECNS